MGDNMNKKELTSDAKAVGKLTTRLMSATNINVPLKEKTDNFFKNLINYLENDETEEDIENRFNNHPQTLKKNLQFLMKRFTNVPTKNQLENIKESMIPILENLNNICLLELEKKAKKDKIETS